MKTDDLIASLGDEATPVKPLPSPRTRYLRWLGAALLCLGAGMAVLGLRPDLAERLTSWAFVLQAVLTFGLGLLSAAAAFVLSVPSTRDSRWLRRLPLAVLGLWLILLVTLAIRFPAEAGIAGWGFPCVRDIVILGLLPGAFLFFMIARAAPLMVRWTGMLVAMSAAGLGAFASHMLCANDAFLHVIAWHLLPVSVIGIAGVGLGRLLRRWEYR